MTALSLVSKDNVVESGYYKWKVMMQFTLIFTSSNPLITYLSLAVS